MLSRKKDFSKPNFPQSVSARNFISMFWSKINYRYKCNDANDI